jgi:hypothetical protein
MKKLEKMEVLVTYCDYCKNKINGNHQSIMMTTIELSFHSGYAGEPNCINSWNKLDMEEKSDIIQAIKNEKQRA